MVGLREQAQGRPDPLHQLAEAVAALPRPGHRLAEQCRRLGQMLPQRLANPLGGPRLPATGSAATPVLPGALARERPV